MKIENQLYRLGIDPGTGRIESFFDKASDLELITEPRLADNFRLLLPAPELEANYIFGCEQRLTTIEQDSNGAALRWESPLINSRGEFDIDVVMRIAFVDEAVEFRLSVKNRSESRLAEVWYPILGGLTGFGERTHTSVMLPHKG